MTGVLFQNAAGLGDTGQRAALDALHWVHGEGGWSAPSGPSAEVGSQSKGHVCPNAQQVAVAATSITIPWTKVQSITKGNMLAIAAPNPVMFENSGYYRDSEVCMQPLNTTPTTDTQTMMCYKHMKQTSVAYIVPRI